MRIGRRLALIVAIAAIIVLLVRVIQPPIVPADAASAVLVRTTLTGRVSLDSELADPAAGPPSPSGGECLARIERPDGWLDLCWQAYRYANDADPTQDDYVLRVYGSFQGTGLSGVRWVVVRSRLVGAASGGAFTGWPHGDYRDACQPYAVELFPIQPPATETLCGLTTGDSHSSGTDVTWTCAGCVLGTRDSKPIALWNAVGAPTGIIPVWEIYADLGS